MNNNNNRLMLLDSISIVNDLPLDFYKNPAYLDQVKQANELAVSLVYELSDDGRKLAKNDVAAIRKYAKKTDSFVLSCFRKITDKATAWRSGYSEEIKKLNATADTILSSFDAMEKKKLSEIEALIRDELAVQRIESKLHDDFIGRPDLTSIIKLTAMTPAGKLTSATIKVLAEIVKKELDSQLMFDFRCAKIETACLRSEINPPMTSDHFGQFMFANDAEFDAKLLALIKIEIKRKQEMEDKIMLRIEEEAQRKEEARLRGIAMTESAKKREEELRLADEEKQMQAYQHRKAEHNAKVEKEQEIAGAKACMDAKKEEVMQANYGQLTRREITLQLTFKASVGAGTSNDNFKAVFLAVLNMSEKIKKTLVSADIINITAID